VPVRDAEWVTFRFRRRRATEWAPAGHEAAWEQIRLKAPQRPRGRGRPAAWEGFEDLVLEPPRLQLWRAPTDNDVGTFGPEQLAAAWREAGLDRMVERIDDVTRTRDAVTVRTRVAAAGHDRGLAVTTTWTPGLICTIEVTPEGDWPFPLPRLGARLDLPGDLGEVEWFGLGPGEAYADARLAARVGRFATTIDAWQTRAVMPQENGNRSEVRWAELTGPGTPGLRIEGRPHVGLTVRRWTSEDLDAAAHTVDLVPRDRLFLNLDHAHHGIGSASCGPGVLPQHRLEPRPASFSVVLSRA
jgi:beta-galactosidase